MLPAFKLNSAHGPVDKANKELRSKENVLDKSRRSSAWIQMISFYIATQKKNRDEEVNPFFDKQRAATTILK